VIGKEKGRKPPNYQDCEPKIDIEKLDNKEMYE